MNELIQEALGKQDIPYFYIKRQDNVFPCVVYTYNETTLARGDNKEELASYDIYFNIYCKGNVTENTKKIKEALEDYGFQKVIINAPAIFDGTDYYQITMNYTRWL